MPTEDEFSWWVYFFYLYFFKTVRFITFSRLLGRGSKNTLGKR
nr:MAG TPA: hypothetical protein [Caudoviricetes sp.]DAZ48482.1 MAG TPA: hypothetical protein [Caudoviricetes sp.]